MVQIREVIVIVHPIKQHEFLVNIYIRIYIYIVVIWVFIEVGLPGFTCG